MPLIIPGSIGGNRMTIVAKVASVYMTSRIFANELEAPNRHSKLVLESTICSPVTLSCTVCPPNSETSDGDKDNNSPGEDGLATYLNGLNVDFDDDTNEMFTFPPENDNIEGTRTMATPKVETDSGFASIKDFRVDDAKADQYSEYVMGILRERLTFENFSTTSHD